MSTDTPTAPHAPLPVHGQAVRREDQPVNRCIANIWPERRRFGAILAHLPEDPGRILDVGVVRHELGRRGYGNLHAQLHVSYPDAEIVGIDTDAEGVAAMQSPGYDVRVADACSMDLAESFDAIVAGEVIEHLPNPGAFLSRAAAHLRPGGRVVLTTPNPDAARYFRKVLEGQWTSEYHTCWISPQHLERLAEAADLGVVDIEYLRPPHGLSAWLYDRGRERLGAMTYLGVVG